MAGKRITLKLTEEQKRHVKAVTGKHAEGLNLTVQELEDRIAPSDITIIKSTDSSSPKL